MTGETLRLALLIAVPAAGLVWALTSFLVPMSGTWQRELRPGPRGPGTHVERIELHKLGPFVSGRAEVPGGWQEFSGYLVGRTLHLKRRDHGPEALTGQGYPEAIARLRDGKVAGRYRLVCRGDELVGMFFPLRIEFTHQPPRVTQEHMEPPEERRYRRVVAEDEDEGEA